MITGSGYFSKALQSLIYFLNNEQYQKDGSATTLPSAFSGLNVTVGFPDSLESLSPPTLAIMQNPTFGQNNNVHTPQRGVRTVPLSFSIYGFAGGRQTDGANMFQRDDLCNDIREMLEDTDYIDLYDYPDFDTSVGDMSIESVESRFIETTGTLNAEKYRFVIDLDIEYLKSIGQ